MPGSHPGKQFVARPAASIDVMPREPNGQHAMLALT